MLCLPSLAIQHANANLIKDPKEKTMSEKSQIELGNDWGHYCRNNAAQTQSTSYTSPAASSSISSSPGYDYQPSSPSYGSSSTQPSTLSSEDMAGLAALTAFVITFLFSYPISATIGAATGAMISFNMEFEDIDQRNGAQLLISIAASLILSRIEKRARKLTFVRWIQYLIRTIAILSILGYFIYALNLPKPQ